MDRSKKKKPYKRIALALSLCALVIWGVLGTGASVAWFTDTSDELNNIFHFAEFEITVERELTDGTWKAVDSQTQLFDEDALYEPGYTQVVYLRIRNDGTVPFTYNTAVSVTGYTLAVNTLGQHFNLQDHLRFGLVETTSAQAMRDCLPDREAAARVAVWPLNRYAQDSDPLDPLEPGETTYIALIVRMPEEVGNIANHDGMSDPKVELGVIIRADQIQS